MRPYFSGETIQNTPIRTGLTQNPIKQEPSAIPARPKSDTYTPSVSRTPIPASQKLISDAQDKLFCKILPEKFIEKYTNREFLEKAVKNNPNIAELVKKEGIALKIEPQNINAIVKSHLIPTAKYVQAIMQNSGEYYTPTDYDYMTQAALIHDVGKALIPSEILNKKEQLTTKEREIIKLHNDLGYELLRSSYLSPRVLTLIQNHHGYGQKYPKDSMAQILTVADIYSALKENRAYKKPMSDEQAFKILEEGAAAGDYNINYVNSLKRAILGANSVAVKAQTPVMAA